MSKVQVGPEGALTISGLKVCSIWDRKTQLVPNSLKHSKLINNKIILKSFIISKQ